MNAAIITPIDWIVSPITWSKAARTFAYYYFSGCWWSGASWSWSSLPWLCSIFPIMILTTNPKIAVATMISPWMSSGLMSRYTASLISQPVSTHIVITLTSAPIISARWYPKVKDLLAGKLETLILTIAIRNPEKSPNKCAASERIAIELANNPPTT